MSLKPPGTLAGLAPGIHSTDIDSLDSLASEATERGLFFARIDLTDCSDKAGLLQAFASALAFPSWFGENWDAFADCLADLDWLGAVGHVLLIEGRTAIARHAPEALETCDEILAETVIERGEHGLPMWVFWRTTAAP